MLETEPAGRLAASPSIVRFALDRDRLRDLKARCAELCYSAVLTLTALPDRETTWLRRSPGGSPAPVLQLADIQAEWGLDSAIAVRRHLQEEQERRAKWYRPSPAEIGRYLDVLGWLTWLERERNGRAGRRIICARAFGTSFGSIAERFGKSDETVRRWEAAAFAAIVGEYGREIEAMR